MTNQSRRILGLDPGLRFTGWGIVAQTNQHLHYIAHGTIKVPDKLDMDLRLAHLYHSLQKVIDSHTPDAAAVEKTFLNKNPETTLKLGLARGVVMIVPAMTGLRVGEYSANHIKKTVVGAGHAGKDQVKAMVQFLLPQCGAVNSDEADALAVAICHAHTLQTQQRWVASP